MRRDRVSFELPILPPSVNHYVDHRQAGGHTVHRKTAEAKAFEGSFLAMLPAHLRGSYVVGERFSISITIVPGPADSGDVDNYPKLLLDCCAAAGFLRKETGARRSDSWFKAMHVYIHDSEQDRKTGPRVAISIEELR